MAFIEGFKLGCHTTALNLGPLYRDNSSLSSNGVRVVAAIAATLFAALLLCSPIYIPASMIRTSIKILRDDNASWTTKQVALGATLALGLTLPIYLIDKVIRCCGGIFSSPSYIFADQPPPSGIERSIPHLLKFLDETENSIPEDFVDICGVLFANDALKFKGRDFAFYYGLLENPERQVLLDIETSLAEVTESLTDEQAKAILKNVQTAYTNVRARLIEIQSALPRRQPLRV